MLRADEAVCSSFLSTSLLYAVDVERSVRLVPPCAATGLGTLPHQQQSRSRSGSCCGSGSSVQARASPGQQNLPPARQQHTTLFQRISAAVKDRSLLLRQRRRASASAGAAAPKTPGSTGSTSATPRPRPAQPQPPLVGEVRWIAEQNEWSFDLDLGTEPTEVRCEMCQRTELEPTRRRVSLMSADKTTLSAWQVALNTCFT